MTPRKHKDNLTILHSKDKFDQEFAEDAINFFWENVREQLIALKYNRIYIHEFGTFKIKETILDEEIERLKRMIPYQSTNTFQRYHIYKEMADLLAKLESLKKEYESQQDKKRQVKERRKTYDEQIKTNSEES